MAYLTSVPQLPSPELCAMRMDGDLSSTFTFLDEPDTAQDRARRVLGDSTTEVVLSSWSAAWAWGCAAEPARHRAAFRHNRTHVPEHLGFIVEQRSFHPGDIEADLTTPLRTVVDLLKTRILGSEQELVIRLMMKTYGVTAREVLSHGRDRITAPHQHLLARNLAKLGLI